jgi:hypothetical protein
MGASMNYSTIIKSKKILNNERGMALIETIPLLVIFMLLVAFGVGMFGAIHTGILHNIAARTYAFDTFHNRTNLNFYRDEGTGINNPLWLGKKGWRFHAIQADGAPLNNFYASSRPLRFDRQIAETSSSIEEHNVKIFNIKERNQEVSVSPIWVMVGYGMCVNAQCGD